MSVELNEEAGGKVLTVKLTGKLTKLDYDRFLPEVERLIGLHKKIRVLCELHDFHGWTAGALWQDLKFDLKHFAHIERLAIIGEKAWEHGMALFCKPFTTAAVRYFDVKEAEHGREWISENVAQPAS